jgi:hypothetical protein
MSRRLPEVYRNERDTVYRVKRESGRAEIAA